MKKRILISVLTLFIALSMLTITVSADLVPHAAIEGLAVVKTGNGKPVIDREATLTFIKVLDYHGGGSDGWAVTLETNGKVYAWHIVDTKACGRSTIVMFKADPHPGFDNTADTPSIKIVLNHNPDNPFAVATGKGVLFVGRTIA